MAKLAAVTSGADTIKAEVAYGELTLEVDKDDLIPVCELLRDDQYLVFDCLIYVCGVDYSTYEGSKPYQSRYASVYHLLSVKNITVFGSEPGWMMSFPWWILW